MTSEEQRIAIAEFCEFKGPFAKFEDKLLGWPKSPRVIGPFKTAVPDEIHDYPYDMNARREAWKRLNESERYVLRAEIAMIAEREKIWMEEADFDFWCEAFLRTVGKWKS